MLQLSDALLGTILATVASLMFAFQYLFVRLGTQKGSVTDVVFVTLLSNVVLLIPPAVLLYDISAMSTEAIAAFAAAGLSGSLFARIFSFSSIQRIGANRTSPIVSANALFATLLAVLVLGESLTPFHLVGVVLIVAGIAVISYQTEESMALEVSRRDLTLLMTLPILAAVFLGIEPIFVSIALAEGGSILPGSAIVVTTAFAGFAVYTGVTSGLPSPSIAREPYAKWYLGAGVATTLGLVAAFSALETAPVVIAVPLIQTSPLIVVGLSSVFLSSKLEEVTPLIVVSTVMIIVGATVVSLSG
ncbi:EamA family transporter [Halostella sp. PRR32]|uniref:EamA family transporter n=1 Tax=Halostella sp. PRR32 TaxID=3098147 RepID=UPI002B1DE1D1|nr:EamA family transporter [Halostella sp. PRR32]